MTITLKKFSTDFKLLFATRMLRMFAYGFLAVALALYLEKTGLTVAKIGLLISLTLAGDAAVSLWITTNADRIGRKRMLIGGALLMLFAGVVFAITDNYILLVVTAIIGVISPSGSEVGPFLAIEQAALTQLIPSERRTRSFAWYNLLGSFATATGTLASGGLVQVLKNGGMVELASYRSIVIVYALLGGLLAIMFTFVSSAIEPAPVAVPSGSRLGLGQSRRIVTWLSCLFALDAFGGGLVLQSFMAYWFQQKFNLEPATLGAIFFGANILAGISALSASWLAARIGLINTMVFTHVPSNILLILIPLMPTLPLAIIVLLMRFAISQMDVPTRQSYVMAVVTPGERSAAAGITGIARSVGSSFAPILTWTFAGAFLSLPFIAAGALKLVYDMALYRSFVTVKPPEENR